MTSPTYLERYCWWCQQRLATSYAVAKTPDGNVLVHHDCKEPAEDEFRKLTAQIADKQGRRED